MSMPVAGYLLIHEAALELGVTDQHVRQLIRSGRLRGEQPSPRLHLVDRASVEAYKRERRPPGRPPAPGAERRIAPR